MEFSSTSNESSLPVFNGQKGRGGKVIVHKWQSWIVKVRDCVFPTSCSEFRYPSDSRWTLLILSFEVNHEYIIQYVEAFEHNSWTFEVHFDTFLVFQTVWGILYYDPYPVETACYVSTVQGNKWYLKNGGTKNSRQIKSLVAKFTRVSAHLRVTFLVIKTLLKVLSTFLQAI